MHKQKALLFSITTIRRPMFHSSSSSPTKKPMFHSSSSSPTKNGLAISSTPSCGDTKDTCVPRTTTRPSFLVLSVTRSESSGSCIVALVQLRRWCETRRLGAKRKADDPAVLLFTLSGGIFPNNVSNTHLVETHHNHPIQDLRVHRIPAMSPEVPDHPSTWHGQPHPSFWQAPKWNPSWDCCSFQSSFVGQSCS